MLAAVDLQSAPDEELVRPGRSVTSPLAVARVPPAAGGSALISGRLAPARQPLADMKVRRGRLGVSA